MLATDFAFNKFYSYLIGSKVIAYIDHIALMYFWVLSLQVFERSMIKTKNKNKKKYIKNQVADHLSMLEKI